MNQNEVQANDKPANQPRESEETRQNLLLRLKLFERLPPWLIVTVLSLLFLLLFCGLPLIVIDLTNNWCNLFSGFFNAIRPGICP
jgi:hypothetical protein